MSIHIGIDSGTQSTKAVALDLDRGKVVATARAPHALIAGLPPGHMEQHPRDWAAALDATLAGIAAKLGPARRRRVRGIGVSGQQHGFVPLDAGGRVIRPAKLWCDTSTTRECALLTQKLGGEKAVLRKTGVPFLPGYTAPKILWLKRNEPARYRRLRHVLLPHDFLNFHLTGAYFMEPGDASGTALMDTRRRAWSREAVNAIDKNLADFLPPVSPSDSPAGTLLPAHARRLGFPENITVSAGGGDNMMGAIGTGNVAPGVVTASLGTSGTIFACAEKPVVDPRGEIAAFCSSTGGWLPLLCTMNVTTVTEQIRALFNLDHRALDRAAAEAPAGSAGLLMLPYLAGERTPNLPRATGVFHGLTAATLNPAHIARAAMEGVTLNMNHGLRRLVALGIRPQEIRLTGGGAKSAFWRQLMADIFNTPVVAMQ
ncbi:MAG: xylulokinase, partial [Opitutaceae bacterium]|nr:xylulokinase [Opitutaceae bacterium]